jgi:hypothetical protein
LRLRLRQFELSSHHEDGLWDRGQVLRVDGGDVIRANAALALDRRVNRFFANAARSFVALLVLLRSANKGFVHFDCLTFAAYRAAAAFGEQLTHSIANTMGHRPSGAVRTKAEHSPKLMRAHAFLA